MAPPILMRTAALASVLVVALVAAAPALGANTFSGRAKVVQATVPALGLNNFTLVDTGDVAAGGGELNRTLLAVEVPGLLTGEVGHAAVVAHGNRSTAEAQVASLDVTVAGQRITADFLRAEAEASCRDSTASVRGSAEIVSLNVNGTQYDVTLPGQRIDIPLAGVSIIVNEQIGGASANRGDITVNALHIVARNPLTNELIADVIIAQAHADITCAPPNPCPAGKDFVTGGGWIVAPSGSRGTFSVAGGLKNPGLWGHLTYLDHGANVKVKGLSVTAYVITGPTTRHIEGTAEINGLPGTYAVDVTDNGEPGRRDLFRLTLSTGYTAGGALAGGNIQLHKQCS